MGKEIKGKSPILRSGNDHQKEYTGAYPKMVDGKKTKRTTRSRQAADFNHPMGFRLPPEKFGNPKAGNRKNKKNGKKKIKKPYKNY